MERHRVREASLGSIWGGLRDGIRGTSQYRPYRPNPQASDQSEFLMSQTSRASYCSRAFVLQDALGTDRLPCVRQTARRSSRPTASACTGRRPQRSPPTARPAALFRLNVLPPVLARQRHPVDRSPQESWQRRGVTAGSAWVMLGQHSRWLAAQVDHGFALTPDQLLASVASLSSPACWSRRAGSAPSAGVVTDAGARERAQDRSRCWSRAVAGCG
jgi:hypothetical protein